MSEAPDLCGISSTKTEQQFCVTPKESELTKSCCQKPSTAATTQCSITSTCTTSDSEEKELRWQACGCGCQSNTLFLSCDDPRLPVDLTKLQFWAPVEERSLELTAGKPRFLQRPEIPPPRFS